MGQMLAERSSGEEHNGAVAFANQNRDMGRVDSESQPAGERLNKWYQQKHWVNKDKMYTKSVEKQYKAPIFG